MQHVRHARVEPSVQSEIAAGIESYLDGRRAALETPVPGLALARLTAPLSPTPHVYAPSLCVALRGEKHVDLGDRALVFGADRFFLAAIDVPAILSVSTATPERPFIGLQVRLDLDAARLLIAEMDASNFAPTAVGDPFVVTGRITPDLLGTIARFVKLLETPRDIPILGGMLHREMLYRCIRTGTDLRGAAARRGPGGPAGVAQFAEIGSAAGIGSIGGSHRSGSNSRSSATGVRSIRLSTSVRYVSGFFPSRSHETTSE